MYVRCKLCNIKVQTIQKITLNFREKIQNFAKCKYTGGQIPQQWHLVFCQKFKTAHGLTLFSLTMNTHARAQYFFLTFLILCNFCSISSVEMILDNQDYLNINLKYSLTFFVSTFICVFWGWFFYPFLFCFSSHLRIFHTYGDVTHANLNLYLVLMAIEPMGISQHITLTVTRIRNHTELYVFRISQ